MACLKLADELDRAATAIRGAQLEPADEWEAIAGRLVREASRMREEHRILFPGGELAAPPLRAAARASTMAAVQGPRGDL